MKERDLEGSLTLSYLSQAEHSFLSEEKYSQALNVDKKKEILNQIENKSTREQLKHDQFKPLTPELTQVTFKSNAEFRREVFLRDQGRSGVKNPLTGKAAVFN